MNPLTDYFIGIDPGAHGGIAILSDAGVQRVIAMPLAGKEIDGIRIADHFREFQLPKVTLYAFVEKVGAMPGQGVTSMFTFGKNVGTLYGILSALGISYYLVAPQTWKRIVLSGTDRSKEAAIDYCRRAYPTTSLLEGPRSHKPHDGMADALCIATYGQMQITQLHAWTGQLPAARRIK